MLVLAFLATAFAGSHSAVLGCPSDSRAVEQDVTPSCPWVFLNLKNEGGCRLVLNPYAPDANTPVLGTVPTVDPGETMARIAFPPPVARVTLACSCVGLAQQDAITATWDDSCPASERRDPPSAAAPDPNAPGVDPS